MLMGRPIIEALGIVINFKRQQMMFEGHPWRQIKIGRHGEYLLSLTEDCAAELADQVPSFDLRLEDQSNELQSSGEVMDFQAYQKQEGVFSFNDDSPTQPGERPVLIKHWKMLEKALPAKKNASMPRSPESFMTQHRDPGSSGRSMLALQGCHRWPNHLAVLLRLTMTLTFLHIGLTFWSTKPM